MGDLDIETILISFIFTCGVGLLPPVLIRFVILKRPITLWAAIGVCALFWVFNLILFSALGSRGKTHTALILLAFVSYWILRKRTSESSITNRSSQDSASTNAMRKE